MRSLDYSLPPISPLGVSPRKSSAPTLPKRSRRDSVIAPVVHPCLAYAPSANMPLLVWDVGDVPSYTTVLMPSPKDGRVLVPVPDSILNEPATNPPQREMRIHCVGHSLWAPLVVRADEPPSTPGNTVRQTGRTATPDVHSQAPSSSSHYVAVKHVILAIFRYLYVRMTSDEYASLDSLPTKGLKKEVSRAFYKRCDAEERRSLTQRTGQERAVNNQISPSSERSSVNLSASTARSGGLRRLDCLLGQTRFRGLDAVGDGPSGWYMCVGSSSR
ncbi:uncharacterized protein FOMMEDRAFT_140804 [Fomitiporia mediterranea MF3/22]|uniref:uncharacterized protein n=1 Tax=Fomitiporia mediterranea (strain MF3/22) TaxID=694068 RepID=UPI0004409ABF|nr:uncharacterized protein FOMMEDRAFT_140804 [Fomitiporia mediterranea MF3/22]EJD03039.1 hypothetical protein FOMMEDRAFT_140804 [Fomitiporia mediterranea MF3/22]